MFSLHSFSQYYSDYDMNRFDSIMHKIYGYDFEDLVLYNHSFTSIKDINGGMIDCNRIWDWKFQARFDRKLSISCQLLYYHFQQLIRNNHIDYLIKQLSDELKRRSSDYYLYLSDREVDQISFFHLCIIAINYCSDESVSKLVKIFSDFMYWKGNKRLMILYQSLVEKQLTIQAMTKLSYPSYMNISLDKFYTSDYLEEEYDRQILIGLMLHSFRYSKHIVADQIVNFTLSKTIFSQLEKKLEYFSPIDLYT